MSQVPNRWFRTTLGEVLTLQRGFDITRSEQRPGSIPVVSSSGVISYHNEAASKGPGVVIGRKGTLGKVFYLEGDYWPHDTTLWVKDFKGNFPRFVYYFLKTINFLHLDVGSANPTLNRNHVHPLTVVWPPFEMQESIAHFLRVLDDKIAVNERIGSRSVELLQATWREIANRATEKVKFVDIASVDKGLSYKGAGLGSGAPLVNLANFSTDGRFDATKLKYYSGESKDRHWLQRGDVVVANTDLTQRREILGQPAIVNIDAARALFTHHVFAVRPHEGCEVDMLWLYCALRDPAFRERATSYAAGTTVAALSKDPILTYELPFPMRGERERWTTFGQRMLDMVSLRMRESVILAELRDTLLPKLMSGELRIKDAERAVEEAV